VYLRARYYDPALGRFLSLDPLLGQPTQGANRYAYTQNRPTLYADPSGQAVVAARLSANYHSGLGVKETVTLYLDPDTGQGCVMVAVGGGAGFGGGAGAKITGAPSGRVPKKGGLIVEGNVDVGPLFDMRGSIPVIGDQGGFEITTPLSSVGLSGTGDAQVSLKWSGQVGVSGNLMYSWIPPGWEWSDFKQLESRLPQVSAPIRRLYYLLREQGYTPSHPAKEAATQPGLTFGDLLQTDGHMGDPPSGGK
jgi:hypothetical protein